VKGASGVMGLYRLPDNRMPGSSVAHDPGAAGATMPRAERCVLASPVVERHDEARPGCVTSSEYVAAANLCVGT
jgi:hypothetical protein